MLPERSHGNRSILGFRGTHIDFRSIERFRGVQLHVDNRYIAGFTGTHGHSHCRSIAGFRGTHIV